MKKLSGVLAAMLLFAATQANALTYSFDLNNSGLTGGPWATITLTDTSFGGNDAVFFRVDPLEEAFEGVLPNFGLQSFYFNSDASSAFAVTAVPDWDYTISPRGSVGPYGRSEFAYRGDGSSRANPLEFYVYSEGPIAAGNFAVIYDKSMFAGHIADFVVDGEAITSAQFASGGTPVTDTPVAPVPEPATVALLGLGLAGVAFCRRKQRA